jgi:DNA-binding NarL/FixJ family response regulator
MVRVAILDRHPTVRAGAGAVLRDQHDLVPVGAAADGAELWTLLGRAQPDVVLLDHSPHLGDDLGLCLRIKRRLLGPRVVVHAAVPSAGLVVSATLAGADGIVAKAADVRELLHALRAVAGGHDAMPAVTPHQQTQAGALLARRDRAIYAMRLAGTRPREIAAVVGLSTAELHARVRAIVAILAAGGRAAAPPARFVRPAPAAPEAVA